MRNIVLICHDIRSTHNVGSLLRTAEGLGIEKVYFTGYTPYPSLNNDDRLPHIALKLSKQINKTALNAENFIDWQHADLKTTINDLKRKSYAIVGLEQAKQSIKLPDWQVPDKVAIIVGREVEGIEPDVLNKCDQIVEIPMFGKKESFNVVQAAAMILYHAVFHNI